MKKIILSLIVPLFTISSLSGAGYALWIFGESFKTEEVEGVKVNISGLDKAKLGVITINPNSSDNVLIFDSQKIYFMEDFIVSFSPSDETLSTYSSNKLKFDCTIVCFQNISLEETNNKTIGNYLSVGHNFSSSAISGTQTTYTGLWHEEIEIGTITSSTDISFSSSDFNFSYIESPYFTEGSSDSTNMSNYNNFREIITNTQIQFTFSVSVIN